MKKVSLMAVMMVMAGIPAVFAQQAVNQTTTTVSTTQSAPVTMVVPESTDPWQVSVQGGGLWAQKSDRLHDGSEILGRVTYDLSPNVAIGAESGGIRFVDEMDGTRFGNLYGVPAMADLVLKMPIAATGNRLVPYIYGGAGVIFWSYSKSGYSDDTGTDASSRTHFAAKPGGGLEYYLSPNVALFVEGSYLFSEKFRIRNSNATAPNPNADLNVNSAYGGGGVKIAF